MSRTVPPNLSQTGSGHPLESVSPHQEKAASTLRESKSPCLPESAALASSDGASQYERTPPSSQVHYLDRGARTGRGY